MNSAVVFTSEQLTILNTLNAYFLANRFDADNTANGVTPLTLNTISGVAVFTDPILTGAVGTLRITNSLIVAGSKIDFGLIYPSIVGGGILTLAGYGCGTGFVDIFVYNADGSTASADIEITFQILTT